MENTHIAFVINDIARLYRRRFDERTRSFGITGPQMRALVAIMRVPGINQGMLAERLDVEPITTCRMVDRLEQAELVERRRDPQDRRAWQLYLTTAAEPIARKLQAIGQTVLDDSLRGIPTADRESALALLAQIRNNLTHIPAQAAPNDAAAPPTALQGAHEHG
ncbi:MAG TPA: MarR family transcriptional regulator [Sphingobium sp.]|nr:MarR family transcriptional regulator [Sphingobium sp.]